MSIKLGPAGNKNVVFYATGEDSGGNDKIIGLVIGRYDFALDFEYDSRTNTGDFNIDPVIHVDDSMYVPYCSALNTQKIIDCPSLDHFLSAVVNIADNAKMRFTVEEAVEIYWEFPKVGMRIYPKGDNGTIKVESLYNSTYSTILDTKNVKMENVGDEYCRIAIGLKQISHKSKKEILSTTVGMTPIADDILKAVKETRSN